MPALPPTAARPPAVPGLLRPYALALLVLSLAVALRLLVLPAGYGLAFVTLSPAVLVAFYWCGIGPGVMVSLLGSVLGYLIQSRSFGTVVYNGNSLLATLVFLMSCGLIGGLAHRARSHARELALALDKTTRAEHGLRQILESQTDVICRLQPDDTLSYVNQAFCDFFGVPREQLVGQPWQPVVHPDDVDRVRASLAQLSPAQPVVTVENRACFNPAGQLLEIQSVGRDVTERKELENHLAASRASFKDFYDHAPCGHHSLDREGFIVAANQRMLEWLGASAQEVVGRRRLVDFFTDDSRAAFQKHFPAFIETGRIDGVEFDLVSLGGQTRRLRVSATVVRNTQGRFLMSRSVMHDVTELRRNKEALRQLTVTQAAMLDHDPVAKVKLQDGHVVWSNRALHTLLGHAPDTLQALQPALAELARQPADAAAVVRTQLRMRHQAGHAVWVDVRGTRLPGEPLASLWTLSDLPVLPHAANERPSASLASDSGGALCANAGG